MRDKQVFSVISVDSIWRWTDTHSASSFYNAIVRAVVAKLRTFATPSLSHTPSPGARFGKVQSGTGFKKTVRSEK
jgi:hypothetical protein